MIFYGLFVLILFVSWFSSKLLIFNAHRLDLLAHPNERSSHKTPTPHGGGIGIVLGSSLAGVLPFFLTHQPLSVVYLAVLLGGLLIAIVGFIDDKQHIPAKIRLPIQLMVCAATVVVLGALPAMPLCTIWGMHITLEGVLLSTIIVVALAWWINLFNFMDGVDGIAGSQALFMLMAAGTLMLPYIHHDPSLTVWWIGVVASIIGFLILNWAPAKIFMGDVGSTFLAFMIGMFALITIQKGYLGYIPWLILSLMFVADATLTLMVRLKQGKPASEAHRSHAYQRLARQLNSHAKVSYLYLALNIFWLWPCAYMATAYPNIASLALFTAVIPILCLLIWAKAGYYSD